MGANFRSFPLIPRALVAGKDVYSGLVKIFDLRW